MKWAPERTRTTSGGGQTGAGRECRVGGTRSYVETSPDRCSLSNAAQTLHRVNVRIAELYRSLAALLARSRVTALICFPKQQTKNENETPQMWLVKSLKFIQQESELKVALKRMMLMS